MSWPTLAAPSPITPDHDVDAFSCGEPSLDQWLKGWALKADEIGSARTYVVCEENRVVGYYSLAMGSLRREDAPRKMRHGMPQPLPVVLLGRLAVDQTRQGSGLGRSLLQHALLESIKTSQTIGAVAVMVDAISESAKAFYQRHGFVVSPTDEMKLIVPMREIVTLYAEGPGGT